MARPDPAKLRHAIDSGHTRDKVAFPDPAAAPLGTDEEAAGTPIRGEDVRTAIAFETADDPEPTEEPSAIWIMLAIAVAIAIALAGIIALFNPGVQPGAPS
jgi:hypothetical protein